SDHPHARENSREANHRPRRAARFLPRADDAPLAQDRRLVATKRSVADSDSDRQLRDRRDHSDRARDRFSIDDGRCGGRTRLPVRFAARGHLLRGAKFLGEADRGRGCSARRHGARLDRRTNIDCPAWRYEHPSSGGNDPKSWPRVRPRTRTHHHDLHLDHLALPHRPQTPRRDQGRPRRTKTRLDSARKRRHPERAAESYLAAIDATISGDVAPESVAAPPNLRRSLSASWMRARSWRLIRMSSTRKPGNAMRMAAVG